MVAIQNKRVSVPRKFVRQYHLKKLFYEQFPNKEERKEKIKQLAELLGVQVVNIRKYWNIRPDDTADISAKQLKIIADFFDVKMLSLFNLEGDIY